MKLERYVAGKKPRALPGGASKAERERYKSLKGQKFKVKPKQTKAQKSEASSNVQPRHPIGKTGYFLHPEFRDNLPAEPTMLIKPKGVNDHVWREINRLIEDVRAKRRPQDPKQLSVYINAVSFGPGGPLREQWSQAAFLTQLKRLGILGKRR